jgi:hypothetical protein
MLNIYKMGKEIFKLSLLNNKNQIVRTLIYDENTVNIYKDDSIENVKYKLTSVLDEDRNPEHYCFFYKRKFKFIHDWELLFKKMSSGQPQISSRVATIFFKNIGTNKSFDDEISFQDFIQNIERDKELLIYESLDKNANFYDVVFNPLVNKYNYANETATKYSDLLFNNDIIYDNEIFAIHFSEFLTFMQTQIGSMNLESTMNVYYPELLKNGIKSIDETFTRESKATTLEDKYHNYNKFIDLQHRMFKEIPEKNKSSLYLHSLDFVYYNKENFSFPHEIFFQKFHTTKDTPFVKFNPGRNMENLYRLYTPVEDIYGHKVPYLPKYKTFALMNSIKRSKSVSLFMIDENFKNCTIEITDNGLIYFHVEKIKKMKLPEIQEICKKVINVIINKLIQLFDPSRLIFKNFDKINDELVDILDIKYEIDIHNHTKFSFKKYQKLLNPLFRYSKMVDGVEIKYKRVGHYNKISDIQGFIIEQFNKQYSFEIIRQKILDNFDVNDDKANEMIDDVRKIYDLDDHMANSESGRHMIKLKVNSGFSIEFFYDKTEARYKCYMKSVDHIDYQEHIHMFVTNLFNIMSNSENIAEKYKDLIRTDDVIEDIEVHEVVTFEQPEDPQVYVQSTVPIVNEKLLSMFDDADDDTSELENDSPFFTRQDNMPNNAEETQPTVQEQSLVSNNVPQNNQNSLLNVNENNSNINDNNNNNNNNVINNNSNNVVAENKEQTNSSNVNKTEENKQPDTLLSYNNGSNINDDNDNDDKEQTGSFNVNKTEENKQPDTLLSYNNGSNINDDNDNDDNDNDDKEQTGSFNVNKTEENKQPDTLLSYNNGSNINDDNDNDNNEIIVQNSESQIEPENDNKLLSYESGSNIDDNNDDSNNDSDMIGGNSRYFDSLNDDENVVVFIYDTLTTKTISKLAKLIDLDEKYGSIDDFLMVFGGYNSVDKGAFPDLIEKPKAKTYGYYYSLPKDAAIKLEKYYHTKYEKVPYPVKITNLRSSSAIPQAYQGYTFILIDKKNFKYDKRPTDTMLSKLYEKIQPLKSGSVYVHDMYNKVKGKFNGTEYIERKQKTKSSPVPSGDVHSENEELHPPEELQLSDEQMSNYSLISDNPIYSRLLRNDKNLFFKDVNGKKKYGIYSRTCQWNVKRQPVVLTDKEKKYIDKYHPGTYNQAVQYSTNPLKEKFWYICPRYWNLRTNLPMKSGNVDPDTIISPKARQTNLNKKYVLELKKDQDPGFQEGHPKGYHMPCCFGIKDSDTRLRSIKEAEEDMKEIEQLGLRNQDEIDKHIILKMKDKNIARGKNKSESNELYIKQGNKFPLRYKDIGHLPIELEEFLGFKNSSCYSSLVTKTFKQNHSCLLRYGVENDTNKSFLACIAYIFMNSDESTVSGIIQRIKNVVTIDNILTFHNGNIPFVFYNRDELEGVDIEVYKEYKIYQKLYNESNNNKQLRILINGYENFIKYLEKSSEAVDYTYLWDIVTSGVLYTKGNQSFNLILIRNENNDITNNVSIICPNSAFSNYLYNKNRYSIIIYNKDEYFEPLISLKHYDDTKRMYKRFFDIKDTSSSLHETLVNINSNIMTNCRSNPNNNKYKYFDNIDIFELMQKKSHNIPFKILHQLLNYDMKVIGCIVDYKEKKRFVPLRPSATYPDIDYKLIHDEIWSDDYYDTKQYLNMIHHESGGVIKCKPLFKVVDENMVVGIITNANQFIKINTIIPNDFTDELDEFEGIDESELDKMMINNENDKHRIEYIHKMKLEKAFYITFINTIKLHIHNIENIEDKTTLINCVNDDLLSFEEKYNIIEPIINKYTSDFVEFTDFTDETIQSLDDVNVCTDDSGDEIYCKLQSNNNIMMIPSINLYTGEKNDEKYASNLIFDIISNNVFQQKFLYNVQSLSEDHDNYEVNNDEIIIMESMIRDYYTSLRKIKSKMELHNVYENISSSDLTQSQKMYNTTLYTTPEQQIIPERDLYTQNITSPTSNEVEDKTRQENNEESPPKKTTESFMKPLDDVLSTIAAVDQILADTPESNEAETSSSVKNSTGPQPTVEQILADTPESNEPSTSVESNLETQTQVQPQPTIDEILANTPEPNETETLPQKEANNENRLENTTEHSKTIDVPIQATNNAENIESSLRYSISSNVDEVDVNIQPDKQKYVLKFPKKVDKIRLNLIGNKEPDVIEEIENHSGIDEKYVKFLKSGDEAPAAYDEYIPLSRYERGKRKGVINLEKCIKKSSADYINTSILKKHFPAYTKKNTFDVKTIECNYKMISMILEDFNKEFFDLVDDMLIKQMLIKFYKPYIKNENVKIHLFEKLKKEGKSQYTEALELGKTSIDKVIMDSMYKLTETDVILLSFELNIPITIIYQSSNDIIKLSSFKKHQSSFSFSYYIKASKMNVFYLLSRKNDFRFMDNNLSEEWIHERNNQSFSTFEEYAVTKMRK